MTFASALVETVGVIGEQTRYSRPRPRVAGGRRPARL